MFDKYRNEIERSVDKTLILPAYNVNDFQRKMFGKFNTTIYYTFDYEKIPQYLKDEAKLKNISYEKVEVMSK